MYIKASRLTSGCTRRRRVALAPLAGAGDLRPHDNQIAPSLDSWEDDVKAPNVLETLLKLPPHERADLAIALWDSLDEADQEASVELTPQMAAELDRRLAEHIADPSTGIPWEEVRKKFSGGRSPVR